MLRAGESNTAHRKMQEKLGPGSLLIGYEMDYYIQIIHLAGSTKEFKLNRTHLERSPGGYKNKLSLGLSGVLYKVHQCYH